MERTRRSWIGQEKNDTFPETVDPDKKRGLADDKAYMRSIRTKRADSLTIQELRKVNVIALTGIEVRDRVDSMLASLYRKKADATEHFDEESLIGIIGDIKLLENLLEGTE